MSTVSESDRALIDAAALVGRTRGGRGRRKLSWEQAQQIRARYVTDPDVTLRELSSEYGLAIGPLHRLLSGQTYRAPSSRRDGE